MNVLFHECPTCGASEGAPCVTPKRRTPAKREHSNRPFSLEGGMPHFQRLQQEFIENGRQQLAANPSILDDVQDPVIKDFIKKTFGV